VKLLLDTHVWIWTQEDPDELGANARQMILDGANELLVSSVSTLEIARMVSIGRLILTKELRQWVRDGLSSIQARSVAVDHEIAAQSYQLPEPFHRDPADRMLVASARLHDCTLVSADRLILEYAHVRSADARR
jgi:PIN domain nuclease of toxin-antitoxin system